MVISVCALGTYAHRQPLAYAQIRVHCQTAITLIDAPTRADLVVVAHSKDLDSHADQLRGLSSDQRVVLLSEEPFWDTIWGQDPLSRDLIHTAPGGALRLTQLNHMTSPVFAFTAIPYFLLTNTHFATRYGVWFETTAKLRPADWQRHFETVPGQGAFMMARRSAARYEADFPEADTWSLCNQRTALAEACCVPGFVRFGKGWNDAPPRQALTDWHLEKYLALKGRYRFVGAIENTHQPHYVTEKIFDAWATGAIPLYMAGPGHRVHDLALAGSWLNLATCSPSEAPACLDALRTDPAFCDIYAAQQRRLLALFADRAVWQAELDRLRAALLAEFGAVLNAPAP